MGRSQGVVFTGGSFRRGLPVPIGVLDSLREGFGVGFRWVVGGGFLCRDSEGMRRVENRLDKPKNRHGRYGFPGFYSISISTVGVDEARVFLSRFSFLALRVVVVDISQFPARKKQGKAAENTQNTKEFLPWLEKTKEIQNTKERKIKVVAQIKPESGDFQNSSLRIFSG